MYNHANNALVQLSRVARLALDCGYEFTQEECSRVLSRLGDNYTIALDDVIEDVAESTNCPTTLNRRS